MARILRSRIDVEGTLVALDALHPGSGVTDYRSDLSIAQDGEGNLYAAGTSLTGALRAWCERRFPAELVETVFGFQNKDKGHASFLFVEDGVLEDSNGTPLQDNHPEIREHVGLDDQYGTAAAGIKFNRAVVPAGTKIKFHLLLQIPQTFSATTSGKVSPDHARAMLAHLLTAMQSEDGIRIGAGKSRGLGRVQLTECSVCERSYGISGLSSRLGRASKSQTGSNDAGLSATIEQWAAQHTRTHIPRIRIEIHWTPQLPTMSKSSIDGLLVDTVPLLGATNDGTAPLIAGSSLKGIFRSRAELILRTIRKRYQPDWAQRGEGYRQDKRFRQQLGENLPLIASLFGRKGSRGTSDENALAALSVMDCFSKGIQSPLRWAQLFEGVTGNAAAESVDRGESDHQLAMKAVQQAKLNVGRPGWKVAFHNAINRWTGGTVDNKLFQVLEPHSEVWHPFVLELDLDRIGKTYSNDGATDNGNAEMLRKQSLVLLLLVLRDLTKQRIPIGFGGNRGLGEIAVSSINMKPIEGQPFGLRKPLNTTETQSPFSAFEENDLKDLKEALETAWQTILPQPEQNEEPAHV